MVAGIVRSKGEGIEPEPEPIIDLKGISTAYEGERFPTIHEITLKIEPGEFVCLAGPNGAGKTTMLETINGLLPYNGGTGRTFGLEIRENRHLIRKRTGYVIQNYELDPLAPFLCRDVVMMGRVGRIGLLRYPTKQDWGRVEEALEAVHLSSLSVRPAGKLSGGEFQKILIARAVAQDPELFLLDEPFSNLDLTARAEMTRLVEDLHEGGKTIVMVSHDLKNIPPACHRIVLMDRGRIVLDGKKEDVLSSEILDRLYMGCCH